MRFMALQYKETDRVLEAAIRAAVVSRGIPRGPAAIDEFAEELLETVIAERRRLHALEVAKMLESNPALVVDEYPSWLPFNYLKNSIWHVLSADTLARDVENAARRNDPINQRDLLQLAENGDFDELVVRRLTGTLGRIARNASREAVTLTARKNRKLWARQAQGDTCAFCSMLVSRGAVYGAETVKFHTHDHCDCTAVLVEDPRAPWDGKEDQERLRKLWDETNGLADYRKRLNEEREAAFV